MVDVDVCAVGDSSRRKMDSLTDSAVEIVPLELYDSARAKIAANLQWICAKAYGIDNIPDELKDPFYVDQYEQEHIKPPAIKLLLSSELYCRVCSLILKGDQVAALQGHQSVIQALSRKGIYVMESDDTPVSESDLACAPIKMSSHMAMIDSLMMAYTVEMISIEKVVASVKRFSTFSASKELPYDLEDAMVFWINKVNLKMREIIEREVKLKQQLLESPGHQKVRYRRDHLSSRQLPYFPLLEDLMKDGSDGAALLAVIHYYCPEQMKLDDICLKEVTSIADSLYNIQLLREFSNEYLNKCFYLTLEDMLYAPLVLKPNVMVFIAELFWWFENVKPDFVQPRDIQEIKDAKTVLQQKSSRPPVPISNATKRSFMASPASTSPADLQPSVQLPQEACNSGKGSPAFSPSHPLLPLRQKQQKSLQEEENSSKPSISNLYDNVQCAFCPGSPIHGHRHRSNSLTRVDGQPRGPVLAWPEKKPRPLSQPTPFALHHATNSDVDPGSGDSISLARSISKDSLASNVVSLTPKHQSHPSSTKTNGKSLLNNVEIEDEDEELIAIIKSDEIPDHDDLEMQSASSRAPSLIGAAWSSKPQSEAMESKTDSFYLEPLMPAVLKPAKEKQIINKEDECGEGKQRGFITKRLNEGHHPIVRKKANSSHGDHDINRTFTPISSSDFTSVADPCTADAATLSEMGLEASRPLASSSLDPSSQEQSTGGFFLHAAKTDEDVTRKVNVSYVKSTNLRVPSPTWTMVRQDSDSDLDTEVTEQDLVAIDDHPVISKYIGEEESAKLQEDMKVKEHEDKDDASGRSSPCLSTISQVSSVSMTSGSIRMTNFAERKLQRLNSYETKSSTSSSQKTTPDGSESCPAPLTTWKQKREQSPTRQNKDNVTLLASELVQLHMQLEEKRRAIEAQKKKMEALSARQRLKLGKAAFLHVVKKGKAVDVPQPIKPEHFAKEYSRNNGDDLDDVSLSSKSEELLVKEEEREEMFYDSQELTKVKMQENLAFVELHKPKESVAMHEIEKSKIISAALLEGSGADVVDISECDLSIEKLNETITTLQQAILKISHQQELLMKSPTVPSSSTRNNSQDQKVKPPIHFVEPLSPTGMTSLRKPPRFGQGRGPRSGRPGELKVAKDRHQNSTRIKTPTQSVETLPHLRPFPSSNPSRTPTEAGFENSPDHESGSQADFFFDSYRRHDENNQRAFVLSTSKDANIISEMSKDVNSSLKEEALNSSDGSGKENVPVDEPLRSKVNLIEVDLSDLKAPDEEGEIESQGSSTDLINESDQKSGVGFFFKDEHKAEDELAKKRAAFLLKQQRKAEEARIRKQQLEAEVEQKRDEARRKAEEDRIRKEEEKARRELIKQEYLRKKQQQILEEQGLGKPKSKPKKPRPKSVHREESYNDSGTKCSSTPDNLSSAHSGSSLSLASAATTEPESIHSGGTPSQRVESMESLPILSRNPSRNTERDWENASTASSIASVAEYTGPKLFKEPSSKSNKPIIHNAISHCCLAGKVNEPHKNSILEELEKCDANHYIILFRDAGCQFRALYCYYPDTEEIYKLTGTGPKSINKKMIDKLYKYSSDRKQFNLIPAKTMSVSVDALTIHNYLWQAKRPAVPKKTQTHK
ncbi:calmodulin-regulated spectrin-associated protein 1 isoform X2 [Carettochelys insculpta]|uniref:calmodulin-regulated spectrin-associated protein 1 isoform X2 n=1 Tax=Carettochelys insculpta TaxID=44489 RepID=UPI003EB86759